MEQSQENEDPGKSRAPYVPSVTNRVAFDLEWRRTRIRLCGRKFNVEHSYNNSSGIER